MILSVKLTEIELSDVLNIINNESIATKISNRILDVKNKIVKIPPKYTDIHYCSDTYFSHTDFCSKDDKKDILCNFELGQEKYLRKNSKSKNN